MLKNSKIFVAGHKGLVGSAILRNLQKKGYKNIVTRTRQELDLLDSKAVDLFFKQEKPEYVFLAAARVGGILDNSKHPADFIRENLILQTNVITAAHTYGVKKLLFLGSSCIYPKLSPQPIKESYLLTGPLE
ncbi:MAG: NAD-dependent epimerase/dehydratase family protein, partial [Candidatus Taylorbacteria bacterium]|nr:NAD-dependent epimerase/dehydratase family protein [Candidatus Taylorbacteria bacterium]